MSGMMALYDTLHCAMCFPYAFILSIISSKLFPHLCKNNTAVRQTIGVTMHRPLAYEVWSTQCTCIMHVGALCHASYQICIHAGMTMHQHPRYCIDSYSRLTEYRALPSSAAPRKLHMSGTEVLLWWAGLACPL